MDQTSICNIATKHLGIEPITSIDDTTPTANTFRDIWDGVKLDVFSEHQWGFANVQMQLSLVSATIIGWSYVYGYPNNVARVWNIYNQATYDKKITNEFEKMFYPAEGRHIICSNIDPTAYVDCSYVIDDCGSWDPKFVAAFALRLASEASSGIIGDVQKTQQLMNGYIMAIAEAKRVGSIEKVKNPYRTQGYVDARG